MTKYLISAALILLAFWAWRKNRRVGKPPAARQADPSSAPRAVVACAHCGLHIEHDTAVRAGSLAFCSDAHRLAGPT